MYIAAALLALVVGREAAAQAIAVVEADATVREDAPATPFGTDRVLEADPTAGRQAVTFLRLRASGIGTATVVSARLQMTVGNPAAAGSDSGGALRLAPCGWDESTLTWATRPSIDAAAVARVGTVGRKATVAFDVTDLVTADGTYCLALVSESATRDGVAYQAREAGSVGPRLDIALLPPPPTSSTTTLATTTTRVSTTTTTTTSTLRASTTTTLRATSTTTSTLRATSTTTVTTTTTRASSTSTTTSSATTSTTPSGAGTFGCLAQPGPLVTLTGTIAMPYDNNMLAAQTRIDTRTATFLASPTNLYPFSVGGDAGVCLAGAVVLGQYDRTWSWSQMHDLNNAGVAFTNAAFTVDGVRIDNVTDGIRPRRDGGFAIRNVRLSYIRDDCVENDHLQDGIVEDVLFDGCYTGFSARPSPAIVDSGYNGANKVWTIARTLVRLQPMPGPDGGSADGLGHGGFFKWHLWDDPANSLSPKLALHDNIFLLERVGQPGGERMGVPPGQVVSCSGNVIVWLGAGPFPGVLPPGCFTVTTDRRVWDAAVNDWVTRHPEIGG